MTTVRRSLGFSFAARLITLLVAIVSVAALARLLTPEEIGVFSVGAAVMLVGQTVREFGISGYLVQEKELTRDRIRAAYGISFVIAWSMGALLIAVSGAIARFYEEPRLQDVMMIMAIPYFIIPFGLPAFALMVRQMRFDLTMRITVGAALAGPITSIPLAANGFSYYSLAWGAVAHSAATVLMISLVRPADTWLLPGFREWRRVFSFGVKSSVLQMFDSSAPYVGDLAIGRVLGFASAGIYSRAMSLITLFQEKCMLAIYAVVGPAFARASREGADLQPWFVHAVTCITGVAWPFYVVCGVMASPIIHLMFGDQWTESIPLVRVLCIGGAVYAMWNIAGRVLVSTGFINQNLQAIAVTQSFFIIVVIGASFIGLAAVAWAYVAMTVVGLVVNYYHLVRRIGVSLPAVARGAARSLPVTAGALAGPAVFTCAWGFEPERPLLAAAVMLPLSVGGWLAAVFAARHPLGEEVRRVLAWAGVCLGRKWPAVAAAARSKTGS